MANRPKHNFVGETIGEFRVESYAMGGIWRCLCSCGNERLISSTDLAKRRWKSCGCRRAEHVSKSKRRHAHSLANGATPTYRSWASMLSRCRDQKNARYYRYGGRGITVCDRWHSFDNFLADMGERPEGMTLDRRENDGNYEPENCRWATAIEQGRSSYQARMVTAFGQTLMLAEWSRRTGIKRETIARRLNAGWPPERALGRLLK